MSLGGFKESGFGGKDKSLMATTSTPRSRRSGSSFADRREPRPSSHSAIRPGGDPKASGQRIGEAFPRPTFASCLTRRFPPLLPAPPCLPPF
jgi:hypothetical protein